MIGSLNLTSLLDAAEERIRQTGRVKHDDFWASLETTAGTR